MVSSLSSVFPDPGKTLPEALDYSVFWLQTVAGEADGKTGIPPPLLCLQIKDFLNGPGEDSRRPSLLLMWLAKQPPCAAHALCRSPCRLR